MQDSQAQDRIKSIRQRMGMTQQQFADMLGMSQGNVGHYEAHGQMMPPDVVRKLIIEAASRGHRVTYDDVYGVVDAPVVVQRAKSLRAELREQMERKKRHAED